jgi:uncharacterized cupin superfamily protein
MRSPRDRHGRRSLRMVEPHGLLVQPPVWYVLALGARSSDPRRPIMQTRTRPPFIQNIEEIPAEAGSYPGSDEVLSEGKALARAVGLTRVGVHHERLRPGTRTSWPHAEKTEEEFVLVIKGHPSVWLNGTIHALRPGDVVGFPAGTGIAHTFLNDTDEECELFVVGERRADNEVWYPFHADGHARIPSERLWRDPPLSLEGDHDGLPKLERERRARDPRSGR